MYLSRIKLPLLVSLLILTAGVSVALAQASTGATTTTPDWETLRPDGEEFSVLMPKGSTVETSKEPYHKMELNTRTYISNRPAGAVFAVVSLSGIKSNPAQYTEMQRVNSYVDAFKDVFAPKVRKGAVAKLTLVGEKTLYGHAGREYRMTLGDLTGTARFYATRKRFYSVVYLNTKKDEAVQEEFLSSFNLPERVNQTTATNEAPPTPAPQVATTTPEPAATEPNGIDKKQADAATKVAATAGGKRDPISGGVLNGKAISLPKPDYPDEAKNAGVEGVVVIKVTIDEQGNVTEAHAVSGPKMLHQVSINAALQAKFSATLLSGEPVRVTGVLVFNFGRPMG